MALQCCDRIRVIEFCVVFEVCAQFSVARVHFDAEVVTGNSYLHVDGSNQETRQFQIFERKVLEAEHGLKEWRVAYAALCMKLMHQGIEGHILMIVGAQCDFAHSRKKLRERWIASEAGTQHKIVYEEAYKGVKLRAVSIGRRRAND